MILDSELAEVLQKCNLDLSTSNFGEGIPETEIQSIIKEVDY